MAVYANKLSSALQLKVKTGVDASGNDVTALQTFRGVKTGATNDDMYAIAQAILGLESTPVVSIIRADSLELVSQ